MSGFITLSPYEECNFTEIPGNLAERSPDSPEQVQDTPANFKGTDSVSTFRSKKLHSNPIYESGTQSPFFKP